jgi:hypothetical protein
LFGSRAAEFNCALAAPINADILVSAAIAVVTWLICGSEAATDAADAGIARAGIHIVAVHVDLLADSAVVAYADSAGIRRTAIDV